MPSISIPADSSADAAPAAKAKVRFSDMFRTADGRNHLFTFVLVSTLFALWGFCNGQLEVLNKKFQDALQVSIAWSTLVQFVTFIGYGVMAIPAGMLTRKFGYKGGIIIGLGLVAVGAFWFYPATRIATYPVFLLGLFVIACGLACLETVANPYTTVLGPPHAAAHPHQPGPERERLRRRAGAHRGRRLSAVGDRRGRHQHRQPLRPLLPASGGW